MSRAYALVERLEYLQKVREEILGMGMGAGAGAGMTPGGDGMLTYVFKGFPSSGGGFGAGSTASTKNVEDHLRAKGLIAGQDFQWRGPMTLHIRPSAVNRDVLDSIQSSGGFEARGSE